MDTQCVLNLGVTLAKELDLDSPGVEKFATTIMQNSPIDKVDRNAEKPGIDLYQTGTERHPREIELRPSGLQVAAGIEITPAERIEFVELVANAAEQLGFSKLDLKLVDVRFIFSAKHWGNHHRFLADVFWPAGPIAEFLKDAAIEPHLVDWTFNTHPHGDGNLALAVTVLPSTSGGEIRSGNYDGDEVSLMFGLARTGAFLKFGTLGDVVQGLIRIWEEDFEAKSVQRLVAPLLKAAKATKT